MHLAVFAFLRRQQEEAAMISAAVIVFREVLEAALVISIVLAATQGVRGRMGWVTAGIGAGLAGSAAVAAFAQAISAALAGVGQEVFNSCVLFLAVAMLGWHNVWMGRHGRQMAQEMTQVGRAVKSGASSRALLGGVVALAVLREGAEVVLFLFGIAAADGGGGIMAGGLLGLAAGVVLGAGLYLGLLRVPQRLLFSVTSWLILLLAAGMAAQGANFLVQAGLLPALGTAIWDTSGALAQSSAVGLVLHVLVGYMDRPDGIQLLFYGATVLVIGTLMLLWGKEPAARQESSAATR
jgi:high-affinity iron transporter